MKAETVTIQTTSGPVTLPAETPEQIALIATVLLIEVEKEASR